jgi:hypothetical protein
LPYESISSRKGGYLWTRNQLSADVEQRLRGRTKRAVSVIDAYVRCLPDHTKMMLRIHGVLARLSTDTPCTFSYAGMLRRLDYARLHHWTCWWLNRADDEIVVSDENMEYKEFLLVTALCRNFFAQSRLLHALSLHDSYDSDCCRNAIPLASLCGAAECLRCVRKLVVDQHLPLSLLFDLAECCQQIKDIEIFGGKRKIWL